MNTPLDQAEAALMEHIRCFRITTPEHANTLCGLASLDATTAAITALRGRGLLNVGQLFSGLNCYSLSRAGFQSLQASAEEMKAISPRAIIEAYGILSFCAASPNRQKLTRETFLARFPELAIRGAVQGNYYLDSDERISKLGFIAVDHGENINRVIHRLEHKIVRRRAEIPIWAANFVSQENPHFLLAFVTPSAWKANKFTEYFQKTFPYLPLRPEIVPELFKILNRL